jgi:hypothetical protein
MTWVQLVLGGLVVVAMLILLAGALSGRVRVRSCCAVSDPRCDLRMRGAFTETGSIDERRASRP